MSNVISCRQPRAARTPRRFIARVLYDHFASSQAFDHPARESERVNLAVVVAVTPLAFGEPQPDQSFYTLTKNVSLGGAALVINCPMESHELLVGFRPPNSNEMTHLRGIVRYQEELGGGFRQLGVEFRDIFDTEQYPELAAMQV